MTQARCNRWGVSHQALDLGQGNGVNWALKKSVPCHLYTSTRRGLLCFGVIESTCQRSLIHASYSWGVIHFMTPILKMPYRDITFCFFYEVSSVLSQRNTQLRSVRTR